ncbi:MAG: redox-sensing transcriptional repressor Rex [Clostridia bacterium]|nr:redox-sensing transcriptional repressor Rex [Clostridia bacterium]
MHKYENISQPVIKRLPRYYRFLGELLDKGVTRISSRELSDKMGFTASQIRQDLNCFGGFGQQGYGYAVQSLYNEIGHILGLDHCYKAILIGAGNLGKAVAVHMSFEKRGFKLIGIFDNDPAKVGTVIRNITVTDLDKLEEFCKENKTDVAIFTVPKAAAPSIADRLYQLGIRNYWNFSHYDLSINYDDIIVENVHLNDSLMILCYKISDACDEPEDAQEFRKAD